MVKLHNGREPEYGEIQDLLVRPLEINVDDRGILAELVRTDWQEFHQSLSDDPYSNKPPANNIQQVYLVMNTHDTIRGYHKHAELVDYFTIVHGNAVFVFYDDRPGSPTYGHLKKINATDRKLSTIFVPAGVFHGWKAEAGTILISSANQLYKGVDKDKPADEVRIPWDTFGKEIWDIEIK
jgi:dTDP-4-dehydrorhamnose 3,5-epimerase-like enzyme